MANALAQSIEGFRSTGLRTELSLVRLRRGGEMQERCSARSARSFDRAVSSSLTLHRDEQLAVADKVRLLSLRVASVAARDEVLSGVVPAVVVDVIDGKRTLSSPSADQPRHWTLTPVARMRARTNLLVEHLPVLGNTGAPRGEKWMSDCSDVSVASHAPTAPQKGYRCISCGE